MEHYFLYICYGIPTSEEKASISNFILSLVPQHNILSHLHSEGFPLDFLKCSSVYFSALNSYLNAEENIEWNRKDSEVNVNDFVLYVLEHIPKEKEIDNQDKSPILASHIHWLADQLPSCGSHKLEVILHSDILINFSVSEDAEFASALYRLFRWHGAHTTILQAEESDDTNIKKWCEIMDMEFLEDSTNHTLGPSVWRGDLRFLNPNQTESSFIYPGFQLRLDFNESEIHLNSSNLTDYELSENDHLILSPEILLVDECNFASIPVYLFPPISFRLSVSLPNMFNERSIKLFQSLKNRKEVAFIVQMGYSIATNKPKPDRSLSTVKWQKMILSGDIKFPDIARPVVERHMCFAITKSSTSENIIAFPLRDSTNLNAKISFLTIDLLNFKQSSNFNYEADGPADYTEIKLPCLDDKLSYSLMNKINCLKRKKIDTCDGNQNNLNGDLQSYLLMLQKTSLKQSAYCLLFEDVDSYYISHDRTDPVDWPERIHLLQKQLQVEESKQNMLPRFLHNLTPQKSEGNVYLSSEDVRKYFKSSGESKDITHPVPVSQLNYKVKHVNVDLETMLNSRWPEIIKCIYHDVYYNIDKQSEEKESVGNNMAQLYVQHDTATSCNKQQLNPNTSILVRTSVPAPKQKWRSPLKQRPIPKKSQNLVYKTYIDSSQTLASKSRNDSIVALPASASNTNQKPGRRQLIKKAALPMRCSPRKKKAVMYSVKSKKPNLNLPKQKSTMTKSNTNRQKQSSTAEKSNLSQQNISLTPEEEIAKKKLRVAVASALEKNAINLGNALFRPCFKKLFTICQAFVKDIPRKKGSTSQYMQKIADAHVKQVIEFEKQK
ncbi:mdm2-binding protein-like [Argiope bruennichi]|uniref:mdm2-binding protein-like n=1 Tax=Argiope bruennichi TaxID=94029 RepID=UPI002494B16F|nr:mdm2-binding protein-like [Argiope bruennichi]